MPSQVSAPTDNSQVTRSFFENTLPYGCCGSYGVVSTWRVPQGVFQFGCKMFGLVKSEVGHSEGQEASALVPATIRSGLIVLTESSEQLPEFEGAFVHSKMLGPSQVPPVLFAVANQ